MDMNRSYQILLNALLDFPGGSDGKASVYSVRDLGWEDSLEKEMATHSSTLALKIPWIEELGAWGCKESARLSDLTFTFTFLNALCQGSSDAAMKADFYDGSSCFRRHVSDRKCSWMCAVSALSVSGHGGLSC